MFIVFLMGALMAVPSFFTVNPVATAETTPTPQDLVQMMQHRIDTLRDYQCQLNVTSLKKGNTVVETNNYFFKKPKLIRLEVTSGKDKGAQCVLQKNGKVRAKAGGVLGLFTITMEPTDKRLLNDDGSGFTTTDFASVLKDIRQTLNGGTVTVSVVEQGRKLYHLNIERTGKRDLIVIDAAQQLPVEWFNFRGGRFDSKTEWKNLRVDVGLADKLFEL